MKIMRLKNIHKNKYGDTEYTVENRSELKSCKPYENENGDVELTMYCESLLLMPIGE